MKYYQYSPIGASQYQMNCQETQTSLHMHLNITSVDRDHFEKSTEKSTAWKQFQTL